MVALKGLHMVINLVILELVLKSDSLDIIEATKSREPNFVKARAFNCKN